MMDRRQFLKGVAAGVAAAHLPKTSIAPEAGVEGLRVGDLFFDLETTTISYVGPEGKLIDVHDLYRGIEKARRESEVLRQYRNPMRMITPQAAEVVNDWTIDAPPSFLRGGSLRDHRAEAHWISVISLGGGPAGNIQVGRPDLPLRQTMPRDNFPLLVTPDLEVLEFRVARNSMFGPSYSVMNSYDHLGIRDVSKHMGPIGCPNMV